MRKVLASAALACFALFPAAASAQGKPSHLVVAFPPGGPTDFVARILADQLTRILGAPAIVENRPGANGNIAAEYVAKASPDGSVLFFTSVGVDSNNWYAVLAPAHTPRELVARLNGAIRQALEDKSAREKLVASGAEPAPSTPEELAALIKEDGAKWAQVIRQNTIKAD